MQPEFFRISQAINYTIEYYEIGKIYENIKRFGEKYRGSNNSNYVDRWNDLIFTIHERMENEILQVIYTTNKTTQNYVFELLKDWLTDWRIENLNIGLILKEINNYNDKKYNDFCVRVEDEVTKFRTSPNFHREDLEEYEIEVEDHFANILGLYNFGRHKKKVIHHKYYCIEETPDYIDTEHLLDYLGLVDRIITNFRSIVKKYTDLYDKGKIEPATSVIIETKYISAPVLSETNIELPAPKKDKLKVNLSLAQLVAIFTLLSELENPKIFSITKKKDLHEFIAANFVTKAKDEDEDISVKKISNLFTDMDLKTKNFWKDKLAEMQKILIKK